MDAHQAVNHIHQENPVVQRMLKIYQPPGVADYNHVNIPQWRGRRVYEYLSAPGEERDLASVAYIFSGEVGIVAGGIFGLSAGAPLGPPGMAVGALVGAGVGGVLAVHISSTFIQLTDSYTEWEKDWKVQNVDNRMFVIFDSLCHEDPAIGDRFNCTIGLNVISQAVIAPDGKLYDLKNIENYIHEKECEYLAAHPGATLPSNFKVKSIWNKDILFNMGDLKPCDMMDIFVRKRQIALIESHLPLISSATAKEFLINLKTSLTADLKKIYFDLDQRLIYLKGTESIDQHDHQVYTSYLNHCCGWKWNSNPFKYKEKRSTGDVEVDCTLVAIQSKADMIAQNAPAPFPITPFYP